ncbi:response regulator [Rathayibacter sp. KR2-224]|uniref:response regulator n=1 Tax=Rathayibacter sp. KR2-224 TaxID=3400913 RepID=UPI003C0302BC
MISVLVVEDEEIAAAAHAEYVRRVDGFRLAGIARTGEEAVRMLREARAGGIDLVLLDMNLPDMPGLVVAGRVRALGIPADIIAVTAVRELGMVRNALSLGVVQYLIKPFTFSALRDKLEHYLQFRQSLPRGAMQTSQAEVDRALAALRTPSAPSMPKGLSSDTLERVTALLRAEDHAFSAAEVSSTLAISRVTARRYLEHLADSGLVYRTPRHGTPGRPELEYRCR